MKAPPSGGSAIRISARYRAHQVDADNLMLAIFGPLTGAAKSALNEPLKRVLHQHGEFCSKESSPSTLA
ncbi:MAG: hypothetical protein EBR45_03535 [Betaproteobacteria bacterium]|nr:hypothetical protein [Betaproteobacteria bacterium]